MNAEQNAETIRGLRASPHAEVVLGDRHQSRVSSSGFTYYWWIRTMDGEERTFWSRFEDPLPGLLPRWQPRNYTYAEV